MAKDKKKYDIKYTTYLKKPTGEKDYYGRNVYEVVSKKSGVHKNTNYSDLKHDAATKAKNKELFANWGTNYKISARRTLKSTVKQFSDGSREITYFGR